MRKERKEMPVKMPVKMPLMDNRLKSDRKYVFNHVASVHSAV